MKSKPKQKSKKKKKSYFGALKGVGSFTKEDKKWMEGRSHD